MCGGRCLVRNRAGKEEETRAETTRVERRKDAGACRRRRRVRPTRRAIRDDTRGAGVRTGEGVGETGRGRETGHGREIDGTAEATTDGMCVGTIDGTTEGTIDDGTIEGTIDDGTIEGTIHDMTIEGTIDVTIDETGPGPGPRMRHSAPAVKFGTEVYRLDTPPLFPVPSFATAPPRRTVLWVTV